MSRYMPVIKAPEYYEVTGEEPPIMPDIDEARLVAPQKYARRYEVHQMHIAQMSRLIDQL